MPVYNVQILINARPTVDIEAANHQEAEEIVRQRIKAHPMGWLLNHQPANLDIRSIDAFRSLD